MVEADARVDNVGGDALAGAAVKDVAGAAGLGVAEAGEAGGGRVLGEARAGLDVDVLLDVGDLVGAEDLGDHLVVGLEGQGAHLAHVVGVHGGGQELARPGPAAGEVALGDLGRHHALVGEDGVIGKGVVVDDDVPVRDHVLGVGVADGHAEEEDVALGREGGDGPARGEQGREGEEETSRHGGGGGRSALAVVVGGRGWWSSVEKE